MTAVHQMDNRLGYIGTKRRRAGGDKGRVISAPYGQQGRLIGAQIVLKHGIEFDVILIVKD